LVSYLLVIYYQIVKSCGAGMLAVVSNGWNIPLLTWTHPDKLWRHGSVTLISFMIHVLRTEGAAFLASLEINTHLSIKQSQNSVSY
jgi:hypothetical protein